LADRFERSFDDAIIGMALTGPDGRFLQVNPALARMVGREPKDLEATPFADLTHPDDAAANLEDVRRTIAGEMAGFETEKRYLHADGRVVSARRSSATRPAARATSPRR